MNKLLYLLFLSVFLLDFLSSKLGLLGHFIIYLPEVISMIVILIVSGQFILGNNVKYIPPKVVFFLILFFLNIIIGAVINLVPAGPLIAGLRSNLKFIPFFILPFVYHFSSKQIKEQLKLLLFLFIIQSPIALYQRLVITGNNTTGDLVKGTLTSSGMLTILLACVIAVLMVFYLAKRITLKSFIFLFTLMFIPMTINETKSTLILLPLALLLPLYFSSTDIRLKQFIPIIALGIAAGFMFVFIYDYFMKPRWGYGIMDFLTMENRTENYLYKGSQAYAYAGNIGKLDSFIIAFQTLSKNIITLLFGLGIGNVSESSIPGLSGVYAEKYSPFNPSLTVLSYLLWERGVFGVISYYVLFWIVFKDSRRLINIQDGLISTLSNGWGIVILILIVSAFYKNYLGENTISYLFWYFSGYIISEQFRYKIVSRP